MTYAQNVLSQIRKEKYYDCIFRNGQNCKALISLDCYHKGECSFYKSKDEYELDMSGYCYTNEEYKKVAEQEKRIKEYDEARNNLQIPDEWKGD